MPKAKVISFINMKGGGQKTCAVNLAAYLARDHSKRMLRDEFVARPEA